MTSKSLEWYAKNARRIEIGFVVVFVALFVYNVLDWLRLLPGEPGFQPRRMVVLSSAMLVQGIASLVRHRSQRAFWALLAASMALLAATFFVPRQ